ncbi:hypothetical protein HDU87_008014 [Geranomyces variabilis]|uniref:HNH nuclease domain-containing protein n=1 Tax=Geranomyces variabilis TaxID=109894 RepID=A0AAD5XTG4_9FUNG|nr:hypothetical protein HDU87_008014 [Geranomyces variabilis]
MNVSPFLQQFVNDYSHDPALAALPPADPADPAAAHVRLCLSLFLGAQRMFAIHTPLRDTLATLSTNCFDDPTYIAARLHDLQIQTRDQHRCKVTGALDISYVAEQKLIIRDDEAVNVVEAAHVFPFGLRYNIPYLSSMVYPCEFFLLLKQGEHINMVENGLLLKISAHRLFGRSWCIRAKDDGYEVIQWGPGKRRSYAQLLSFEAQPPSPLLINLHGCFAVTCAAWVAVEMWKAEGERDLGLLDDDDEEQTVARADSNLNQTLGEAVSASFASKHTPFVEDEPELLSLGEPAIF